MRRDYCECSHGKPDISEQKKQEECKKCEGDESEYCGGPNSISVYENDWIGKSKQHYYYYYILCIFTVLIG